MLSFIYKSRFISILLALVLFLLLIVSIYLSVDMGLPQHMGTFFLYLWVFKSGSLLILESILILIVALVCTQISNQYSLARIHSYIGSSLYLLCMLLMRTDVTLVWVLIAQIIILILTYMVLSPSSKEDPLSKFFYAGIFLGILILIFPPLLLMVPAYLLASNVQDRIEFRQVILLISGLFLPLIYLVSYLYLTDSLSYWAEHLPKWSISLRTYGVHTLVILSLIIIMVMLFIRDLNSFTSEYNWQVQQNRLTILFMTLGVAIGTILSANFSPSYLMLNAPLLSLMLLMYYINTHPSRFALSFLYIFVILSFTLYYII